MGGGGLRSSIILRSSPSAPSYVLAHRVATFVRSKSFIISINVRCREKREEQEKARKTPRNSYFHSIFSCFFFPTLRSLGYCCSLPVLWSAFFLRVKWKCRDIFIIYDLENAAFGLLHGQPLASSGWDRVGLEVTEEGIWCGKWQFILFHTRPAQGARAGDVVSEECLSWVRCVFAV